MVFQWHLYLTNKLPKKHFEMYEYKKMQLKLLNDKIDKINKNVFISNVYF